LATVAVYRRASTDHQEASPATQLEHITRWCEVNGHTIATVYTDEGYSGGLPPDKRPGLTRLLEDAKRREFTGVVCLHIDRLSRDLYDLLDIQRTLKRHKCQLLFVQQTIEDTPEGRMLLQMSGMLSEYYKSDIGRKIRSNNERRIRAGLWPCSEPALGYIWDKEKKELRIDPDRAQDALTIFETFVACNGNRYEATRRINALGIPTKRGKTLWHPATLINYIKIPFFRGFMIFGDIKVPHTFPLIIPPELMAQVDHLLAVTNGTKPRAVDVKTYSGILYCGSCGRKMNVHRSTPYILWRCYRGYVGNGPECSRPCIADNRVDKLMAKGMHKLLKHRIDSIVRAAKRKDRKQDDGAQKRLDSALREKAQILDLYQRSYITPAELDRRMAPVEATIRELSRTQAPKPQVADAEKLRAVLEAIDTHWFEMNVEEKRRILLAVCPRVDVYASMHKGARLVLHSIYGGQIEVDD
jgi:DNA invertase Pin-like site-specific DNA recombinase